MIYISKEDVLAGYLKERGLLKTESSYKILHGCLCRDRRPANDH